MGIAPGRYPPGRYNSITDADGVRVGQSTLWDGESVRTGVTAVVPDRVDRAGGTLPAGFFVGNGYGKLIGATQITELGTIETPILATGTLSAFRVADALVSYLLRLPGNESLLSVNPVVGETNDGFLSDIRARPITEEHVMAAVAGARGGPVAGGRSGPEQERPRWASKPASEPRPASCRCRMAVRAYSGRWCRPISPAPCRSLESASIRRRCCRECRMRLMSEPGIPA